MAKLERHCSLYSEFRHTWEYHYYIRLRLLTCRLHLNSIFSFLSLSLSAVRDNVVVVIKYWSDENLSTSKILASLKKKNWTEEYVHSLRLQLNVRFKRKRFKPHSLDSEAKNFKSINDVCHVCFLAEMNIFTRHISTHSLLCRIFPHSLSLRRGTDTHSNIHPSKMQMIRSFVMTQWIRYFLDNKLGGVVFFLLALSLCSSTCRRDYDFVC